MNVRNPFPVLSEPHKQDLTNQLITSFKDLIAQGVLAQGVKLPPERDLAKKFGVSRSSLRHALKVLDIMGVLTQRVGDGTYLSTTATHILSEPFQFLFLLDGISVFELLETRLIVEPELAARAAGRASADDLAALRRSLKAMEKEKDDKKLVELDLAFHETIFQASGNRLSERIFTLIHRSMAGSILLTSQLVDWEHTLQFHQPIYAAIDKRRPEEARRRMIEHLTDARELLIRSGEQPRRPHLKDEIRPLAAVRNRKQRN
jgi:GntR family transcriptional repressor for pyruvate dehydrogenase complex